MDYQALIKANLHYGHLARKWNPNMAPFIFGVRRGIHIIDLKQTERCLSLACKELYNITFSGKKIFFVGTKPQARVLVVQAAKSLGMPYVGERWLGGLFTNFSTVRASLRRLQSIEKMMKTEAYQSLSKKECLMIDRDKNKRLRLLGGISGINRLPAAVFVVDVNVEHIAVAEANKLNIPVFAMVDTNVDPGGVDYPIPANDDARASIQYVLDRVVASIQRGLQDRKSREEQPPVPEEAKPKPAAEAKAEELVTVPEEVSTAKPSAGAAASDTKSPQPRPSRSKRRRIGTAPSQGPPADGAAKEPSSSGS